jgi:hypothetical protein
MATGDVSGSTLETKDSQACSVSCFHRQLPVLKVWLATSVPNKRLSLPKTSPLSSRASARVILGHHLCA